jgi:hypothetical protein
MPDSKHAFERADSPTDSGSDSASNHGADWASDAIALIIALCSVLQHLRRPELHLRRRSACAEDDRTSRPDIVPSLIVMNARAATLQQFDATSHRSSSGECGVPIVAIIHGGAAPDLIWTRLACLNRRISYDYEFG